MTPIISYKNYIKNATNKVEARKQLKKWILSQQVTITEAARSLKSSRKTIRKLLTDDDLDYEAKKSPNTCPTKHLLNSKKQLLHIIKKKDIGKA